MKLEQVKSAVEETPNGANIILEWNRPAKVYKTCPYEIRKQVRMVGRLNVDYNNLKAVKAKRYLGELPETPQPIWHGKGQWEIHPFLIRHTETGQRYLRLYNGTSKKTIPYSTWTCDGVATPYESIEGYLKASEKGDDHADCFTVKIEAITRIHHEELEVEGTESSKRPVEETTEVPVTVSA